MKLYGLIAITVIICLLLSSHCLAGGKTVYIEDFDSNINNWYVGSGKDTSAEIKNGRYILASVAPINAAWDTVRTIIPYIINDEDFEIDATLGFVSGKTDSEYGLVWGLYKYNFHYFKMFGNGKYTYGTHVVDKWCSFTPWTDSPKIQKTGLNHIIVKRTGNTQEYFINNQSVGKHDFVPFFGDRIGFIRGPGMTIEVDKLVLTMTRSTLPDGVIVTSGHFQNSAIWPNRRDEKRFNVQVEKGSDLSVTKRIDGKEVTASALIKAKNPNSGCIPALFIQTDDNALLKLEKISSGKITKARFCLYSAGKETGCKETLIPTGETTLRITRKGDKFAGEVQSAGKTITVGELEWQGLKASQVAGALFQFKNPAVNNPMTVAASFEIEGFVVGKH